MCKKCDSYYKGRWYIAYYLDGDYGDIEKYKPSNPGYGLHYFKYREILVDGGILSMNKSRKDMLEFDEYKGKVYNRIG